MNQHNKDRIWKFWQQLNRANELSVAPVAREYLDEAIDWTGSHPLNQLRGWDAVVANFWQPFMRAFTNLRRECFVFIGGQFADKDWVAATGVFSGTFTREWLGIPASGKTTTIRFGEFNAMRDGKIIETYILLDLVDVMRQAGFRVLPPSPGDENYFPPSTGESGILLTSQNEDESKKSLQLVEAMAVGLGQFDGADARKMKQTDFWSPQMHWYGPCGIGASRNRAEYERNHQTPFLTAFPDRKGFTHPDGGTHKARFAEGHFIASTGWPSVRATHLGEYLGTPASGKRIGMRVMDFWRRENDVLVQNRVFIDLVDLFLQFGVDLFARMEGQKNTYSKKGVNQWLLGSNEE
jgi:predicted ester cyclase